MRNSAAVVPFQFGEDQVRTLLIDENPWFVAKDVCDILGLYNVTNAIRSIPEKHKGVNLIKTLGGMQKVNIISEPGLYRLVLRSDKPQAEPFMEWVTSEVLPTIRKTGSYLYTLDLTKIVTKPTPQSLEMLERLTGISFADIDLPEFTVEVGTPWIHWFINSCCQRAEDSKTSATELYHTFVRWYRENIDKAENATPSQRLFGAEMKKVEGVVRFRESAGVYYRGVQLQKGMEVTA